MAFVSSAFERKIIPLRDERGALFIGDRNDRHCSGPNLDATPNEIIRRIERYSGVKLADAFAIPDLDRGVKWHCKYARQNGIHVSPTFMIDGLVQADMSSGDPVGDWVSRLLKH